MLSDRGGAKRGVEETDPQVNVMQHTILRCRHSCFVFYGTVICSGSSRSEVRRVHGQGVHV
eukprot:921-Eustigmatos_ZCMA.PRE.1